MLKIYTNINIYRFLFCFVFFIYISSYTVWYPLLNKHLERKISKPSRSIFTDDCNSTLYTYEQLLVAPATFNFDNIRSTTVPNFSSKMHTFITGEKMTHIIRKEAMLYANGRWGIWAPEFNVLEKVFF